MADKGRILIIDNNDSFTFNLVQLIGESGTSSYEVVGAESFDPEIVAGFKKILISPGPGLPSDFPRMCEVIHRYGPSKEILGICLGHQAIALEYGGSLLKMSRVKHGVTTGLLKVSNDESLFDGIPSGSTVGLYHSWTVDPETLPDCLEITAVSRDQAILAIRHKKYTVRGLQFHPESFMTPTGKKIIGNWLSTARNVIMLLVTLFLGSCTGGFEKVDDSSVFRYNEAANISSLDPAFSRDQATNWATNQLFNGLVQLNDRLDLLPCIAYSWEVSEDGLTYRFFLRQDVKFHDDICFQHGKGRDVTAGDFVFSFNRIKDPATASAGAWIFNYTADQQPFISENDSTLLIRLAKSFPPFPLLLSMPYAAVVPHEAISYYGVSFRSHPVGTGPFRFGYWKEGVKLVLTRNPSYFEWEEERQLPLLKAVSITFLADKQAAFLQFVQGKLDFMSGIDPSYKDELLSRSGQLNPKYNDRFRMMSQPYLNTEYLGILVDTNSEMVKRNPLHNRLIRQAVNFAFDRTKMILYLRNNIGTPGNYGIIPPGMPGFDSSEMFFDYNPDLAHRLIEQAGYGSKNEMPSVTLFSTPDYLDICKYIQHQVAEVGIEMEIEVSPAAAMREMKAMAKLPFFRASWIADYPDAENYLSLFYSLNFCPRGPNYTHYRNEEFDKLFEEAMNIQKDSLRFDSYRKMEQVMMSDAPVIILYYDQVLRFIRNDVHGLGGNPMNLLTLKRVYKVKKSPPDT